jgi:hypothetical protein
VSLEPLCQCLFCLGGFVFVPGFEQVFLVEPLFEFAVSAALVEESGDFAVGIAGVGLDETEVEGVAEIKVVFVGDGKVFCGVFDVGGDVFCLVFEVPVDLVGGAIDVGGVLAGWVGADPVEGGGEVFKVEHGLGGGI